MAAVRNHKTLKDIKKLCADDDLAVLNLLKRLLKKLRVVVDFVEGSYLTSEDPKKSLDFIISNAGKLYDHEIV